MSQISIGLFKLSVFHPLEVIWHRRFLRELVKILARLLALLTQLLALLALLALLTHLLALLTHLLALLALLTQLSALAVFPLGVCVLMDDALGRAVALPGAIAFSCVTKAL